MKDINNKTNPSHKEVEVKSIRVIQEESLGRSKFPDLNGKQKGEISINISKKQIKKMDSERKAQEKKEKEILRQKKQQTRKAAAAKKAPKTKNGTADYSTEFCLINAGVVIIVAAAIAFSLIFLERSKGTSQSENRELYEMPKFSFASYFKGEFTDGVTKYFTDTVPNREKLKEMTKKFGSLLGVSPGDVSYSGNIQSSAKTEEKFTGTLNESKVTIFTGTRPTSTETKPDDDKTQSEATTTTKAKPPVSKPPAGNDTIENGILVVGKGTKNVRAMELYGGGFKVGQNYAEVLNKYKKDLGEYVNVYNMCIPMAVAFYLPEEFEDQSASVIDNINNIRSYLKDVVDVDAYSALEKHTDEYIYSRTDHHWQPLGAYYAAEEFAKTAQVDFADLSTYEKLVKDEFVGTLYGHSGEAELNDNPDSFTYYKPSNEYTTYYYNTDFTGKEKSTLFFDFATGINTYSVFLGKDNIVTEIDTDVKNGRVLVIYKDSFGNALVPFLVGSFEKIYVCDYRYAEFNAVDFCNKVGATDLLFATCMFTNTSQSKVDTIEYNRTR